MAGKEKAAEAKAIPSYQLGSSVLELQTCLEVTPLQEGAPSAEAAGIPKQRR